jgi:hypothetical protein
VREGVGARRACVVGGCVLCVGVAAIQRWSGMCGAGKCAIVIFSAASARALNCRSW